MGPEGREAAGFSEEGVAAPGGATTEARVTEAAGEAVVDSAGGVFLQLAKKTIAAIIKQQATRVFSMNMISLRPLRKFLALFAVKFFPQAFAGAFMFSCREFRHISNKRAVGPTIKSA